MSRFIEWAVLSRPISNPPLGASTYRSPYVEKSGLGSRKEAEAWKLAIAATREAREESERRAEELGWTFSPSWPSELFVGWRENVWREDDPE